MLPFVSASNVFAAWNIGLLRHALQAERRRRCISHQPHQQRLNLVVKVVTKEQVSNISFDCLFGYQSISGLSSLHLEVG
jgi:hypothetical protein